MEARARRVAKTASAKRPQRAGGRSPSRLPTGERRDQIAEAALKILAERGGRHFTAQALATEIGVSDGALFRHFASLEQVLGAAIDRVESILFADFPPVDADPLDRLGRFFRQRIAAMAAHPYLTHLLFSDELAQVAGERGAARMVEFKRRSVQFVRACIDQARQQRLLVDKLDPDATTTIVVGSLMALAQRRGLPARGAATANLDKKVWSTVERLIRRPAVKGRDADERN